MRKLASRLSLATLAAATFACSGSPRSDPPAPAPPPAADPAPLPPVAAQPAPDAGPRPNEVVLTVAIEGYGSVDDGSNVVRAPSTAFTFPRGTRVKLSAIPDAGQLFAGWDGGCAGSAGCVIDLVESAAVTARFAALPPPAPPTMYRLHVSLAGPGAGRIVSDTAGIDCPGVCEAQFERGRKVTLSARAASGSTVEGWSNFCRGPVPCEIKMTWDTWVEGYFDAMPPPPDLPRDAPGECAGLAPDEVPARRYRIPPSFEIGCGEPTPEGSGALLFTTWDHGLSTTSLDFVTSEGALASQESMGWPIPFAQPSGFSALAYPVRFGPYRISLPLRFWSAAGAPLGSVPIMFNSLANWAGAADPGGGVVLAGRLSYQQDDRWTVVAVDGDGIHPPSLRFARDLGTSGGVVAVGVETAKRRILVVTEEAATLTGEWFDPAGERLADPFQIATGVSRQPGERFEATPLIGGGFALALTGPAGSWLAMAAPTPPYVRTVPPWLAARAGTRLAIVRGGRAYAASERSSGTGDHCGQRIEVLRPDGTSCGVSQYDLFPGHRCVAPDAAIGPDGTIALQARTEYMTGSSMTCTWYFWPGALR